MEITRITQPDGFQTILYCHETQKEPLGSVLVLHGMAEYHVRYESFAHALNEEGFDVYLYNHRGHGDACAPENLGFFDDKNGAELVISDAVTLCRHIKTHGRTQNLALFGHSMGSLILRNVIQRYDEMDCAVLCGSTMPSSAIVGPGLWIANLLCRLQGPKHRSAFMQKLMFDNKYYREVCTRTTSDWLTTDEAVVDWYRENPYCGFTCTTSMYRDVLKFVKNSGDKKLIARTRKNLPLFLIAGEKDPVSAYAAEINQLFEVFVGLGFDNVTKTIYPKARHELLNEFNKEEVIRDVSAFLYKQNHH